MKKMKYIHTGIITFNTKKRIERPYLDDIEKAIEKCIVNYLEENDFDFTRKKFRMNICTPNVQSLIL